MPQADYEKLGVFYLGRAFDVRAGKTLQDYVLYDAKDLTTHAVCLGMTGSGKTGLCVALLEEAAIDGIPSIVVDPKGDLVNLALTFPQLQLSDFRPWIDEAEATRRGITPDELAAQTAHEWQDGLAKWDEPAERIQKFRDAVDLAIYTPGSSAGLPLTVLRSFDAPPPAVLADGDTLRAQLVATVSGLLALVGIEADPLSSREHILLANILEKAWRAGQKVELGDLLRQIQTPPLDKVGMVDLETFFPAKDRAALALKLNNVLASPASAGWLTGEPLDIQRLLYTPAGKPRLSILSIAHLSDAERMFFVTILLGELLAWVRQQSGTSSLRALFYMDEVFGYFPPSANPPSKLPMLTLLKQARAFGLGVVLATQNPVDLDYKGLGNTGTWFLGRLQTERDKARVIEGLESAAATSGTGFDRGELETALSALGSRVFLMRNVHEDAPVVFQSRWALSYLRGPLTREQIHTLVQERCADARGAGSGADSGVGAGERPGVATAASAVLGGQRPILPPQAGERFLLATKKAPAGAKVMYRPALLGLARVHFVDAKSGIDLWQDTAALLPLADDVPESLWDEADTLAPEAVASDGEPRPGATFAALPAAACNAKNYAAWQKALAGALYRTRTLDRWRCDDLSETSKPGESEGDFRARLQHKAREERDADVEALRKKYAPKFAALEEQVRKAQDKIAKEAEQAHEKTWGTLISLGTTVLGAVLGRKRLSRTNISEAATVMRSAGKAYKESGDVARARQDLAALQDKLAKLHADVEEQVSALEARAKPEELKLESVSLRPRKSDCNVQTMTLAWVPWFVDGGGTAERAL